MRYERVKEFIDRLKVIDNKMKALNELALKFSESNETAFISIGYEDEEECDENCGVEDGGFRGFFLKPIGSSISDRKKRTEHEFNVEPTVILETLGVILYRLKQEKQLIEQQLQKTGVKFND